MKQEIDQPRRSIVAAQQAAVELFQLWAHARQAGQASKHRIEQRRAHPNLIHRPAHDAEGPLLTSGGASPI
jgi:hypothetical protein